MLDVWGWHPADVNAELVVTPDVTTSPQKIPWTSQDISVGIRADLLDHTGSKDGSGSTVTLYINSRIVCGFFLSWWGGPPQSFERSIWDRVGFYMIHTFLDPSVESQLESFLSLIISFMVQLQHLLLPSLIVTSSQVRVGTPLPLLSCCISGLEPEGLWHDLISVPHPLSHSLMQVHMEASFWCPSFLQCNLERWCSNTPS